MNAFRRSIGRSYNNLIGSTMEMNESSAELGLVEENDVAHLEKYLEEDASKSSMISREFTLKRKKLVFALLCALQIFLNYDSGAISVSLLELQEVYEMDNVYGGLVTSLVYIGLVFSSFVSGWLFMRYQPRTILLISIFANVFFTLLFCFSVNKEMALTLRVFTGMTQAFLVIYAPVWVDEFAPPGLCTLWMSLMQGGVAIGIMVGYAFGGLILNFTKPSVEMGLFKMRILVMIPMMIQAIVVLVLGIGLLFVPPKYIDTRVSTAAMSEAGTGRKLSMVLMQVAEEDLAEMDEGKRHRSKRMDVFLQSEFGIILKQIAKLYTNGVYLCGTMALCSLYFVVTGIQMWGTVFLIQFVGAPLSLTTIMFSVSAATGPILGVVIAGIILDRVGGYKGVDGILTTLKFSLILAVGAVICAYACIAVCATFKNFWVIIVLVWFVLLFGGGIVPGATGVTVAAVPTHMRSFASANSTLIYNLVGYFGGPTICGIIAEKFGGVEFGFYIVLAVSACGLAFLTLALIFAFKNKKKLSARLAEEENALDADEVEYEIARSQSNAFGLSGAVRRASYAIFDPAEESVDKNYKMYGPKGAIETIRNRRASLS